MYTRHLRATDDGLLIIWRWHSDDVDDIDEESSVRSEDQDSPLTTQMSENEAEESSEDTEESAVAFKCIGVTRDPDYQSLLAEVKDRLKNMEEVPVKLTPEPTNQFDSRAIAFQCNHNGSWQTIGYIVREALDDVHDAIAHSKIVSVKFVWVKYKVWKQSPGYYASIMVTRKGDWSRTVKRSCSSFF